MGFQKCKLATGLNIGVGSLWSSALGCCFPYLFELKLKGLPGGKAHGTPFTFSLQTQSRKNPHNKYSEGRTIISAECVEPRIEKTK